MFNFWHNNVNEQNQKIYQLEKTIREQSEKLSKQQEQIESMNSKVNELTVFMNKIKKREELIKRKKDLKLREKELKYMYIFPNEIMYKIYLHLDPLLIIKLYYTKVYPDPVLLKQKLGEITESYTIFEFIKLSYKESDFLTYIQCIDKTLLTVNDNLYLINGIRRSVSLVHILVNRYIYNTKNPFEIIIYFEDEIKNLYDNRIGWPIHLLIENIHRIPDIAYQVITYFAPLLVDRVNKQGITPLMILMKNIDKIPEALDIISMYKYIIYQQHNRVSAFDILTNKNSNFYEKNFNWFKENL